MRGFIEKVLIIILALVLCGIGHAIKLIIMKSILWS